MICRDCGQSFSDGLYKRLSGVYQRKVCRRCRNRKDRERYARKPSEYRAGRALFYKLRRGGVGLKEARKLMVKLINLKEKGK